MLSSSTFEAHFNKVLSCKRNRVVYFRTGDFGADGPAQHTLPMDSTCMACHPNMTLNRGISATPIPARLAKHPRSAEALIFVRFSEMQYIQGFRHPNWLARVSFSYQRFRRGRSRATPKRRATPLQGLPAPPIRKSIGKMRLT